MVKFARARTVVSIAAALVVLAAATATAATLITGADVKDGSLAGKELKDNTVAGTEIKDGSLGFADLGGGVKKAIPVRVAGTLPAKGFSVTDPSVSNTPDGVEFGPYADGGADGGSVCSNVLNGHPLSAVTHLAFEARYVATNDTGGVGVPYLRIFLEGTPPNEDRVIFSPNTQLPDPDIGEGPFHTWVATAGGWRYNDDGGFDPDAPFAEILADHGDEVISRICISMGVTAGTNLAGLLRTWEINQTDYAFGH